MSKTYRAVTKYTYSTKEDSEKRLVGKITTLLNEKNLEKLKEKIMKLNAEKQEIKIVSIEWKNWWGEANECWILSLKNGYPM